MNNNEEPYVPPFIRSLMPNATEEEILQATENLRGWLSALYRIYLRHEKAGTLDKLIEKQRDPTGPKCGQLRSERVHE